MKIQAAALALWAVLVLAGMGLGSQHRAFSATSDKPRQRGDVLLDVLGEFRTVLARYLWFKMDLFHEMLDDEGVAPEQQTEVLPLLRMVSLLDPTMTDAHDIIAWDLYKGHGQTEQALKILDEALSRSEGSFSIHFRRALILYQTGRYDDALQSSKRALEFSKDEFDVLNANRMLYWSAKQVGDKVAMRRALGALRASRPDDELWKSEEAAMNAPPK